LRAARFTDPAVIDWGGDEPRICAPGVPPEPMVLPWPQPGQFQKSLIFHRDKMARPERFELPTPRFVVLRLKDYFVSVSQSLFPSASY
jgi:hypothetical protein